MADTITNSSILNNLLSTYFERQALPRLVANAVLYNLCDTKQTIPRGEGKTVVFNAWRNLNPVSVSLTEGTNPSLTGMSSRKVTATIAEYSRGYKVAELVDYTSSLDILKGATDTLADCAGLSVDKIIQMALFKNSLTRNTNANILSAWCSSVASAFTSGDGVSSTQTWGFPVVIAGTATRISATTVSSVSATMSLFAIREAVKELDNQNAKRFADGLYKMVSNSDSLSDLRRDPDFKGWHQYIDNKAMANGEVLTPVEGVRIYQSNNLPRFDGSKNTSLSLIFGQGAYGCTSINGGGKGFQIIIKRPSDGDTSNPSNMYGTFTFKIQAAGIVLNPSAGRTLITVDRA